jgi:mersacidin/lichenicidin family type 2 lantibiotic
MAGININNLDIDIIRAWKDEEYRNSLSEEQRSQLPENPAGMIELSDEDMGSVVGGVYVAEVAAGSKWCCGGLYSQSQTNPISAPAEFDTFPDILEHRSDFLLP